MQLNWRVSWLYCLIATGTNLVMKLKQLTHYLLQHSLPAVLLTFGITFVPVLGSVAILYAGLVTLRKGIYEGAIMTFAATISYAFSFFFLKHAPGTETLMLWMAVIVAVLINILTYAAACFLVRQMTWSGILQVFALAAVLAVSVIHIINPDIAAWWSTQLTNLTTNVIANSGVPMNEAQLEFIQVVKDFVNGFIAASILLCAFTQLAVSRWWEAYVFAPGMLRRELHNIRLSPLAGALFMLSLVFLWLGNSVVMDIMPILYLLFMTAGLSVLHYFLGIMVSPTRWFWLTLLYITLIYAVPASVVIMATIGLLDVWLDLRKRLRKI